MRDDSKMITIFFRRISPSRKYIAFVLLVFINCAALGASHVYGQDNPSEYYLQKFKQSANGLQKIISDFANKYDLTTDDAMQILGQAEANTRTKLAANEIGVDENKIGMKVSPEYQKAFNAATQLMETDKRCQILRHFQEAAENADKYEGEDKAVLEKIKSSLDHGQAMNEGIRDNLTVMRTTKERLRHIQQNREYYDIVLQQAFYEWLQNQSLPSSTQAMGCTQAERIIVRDPLMLIAYRDQFMEQETPRIVDEVMASRAGLSNRG